MSHNFMPERMNSTVNLSVENRPIINKKSALLTKNIAPIFSTERYRLEMAVREEKKRLAIAKRQEELAVEEARLIE